MAPTPTGKSALMTHWRAGAYDALAGGGLAHAGREHVAHDHALDIVRRGARAPHGLAHGDGTEIGGRKRGENTLKRSDGRAHCARDDYFLPAHAMAHAVS
jgi:hypothetical protein